MAEIINIVSKDFYELSNETMISGNCSNCRELIFYQFSSGFPDKCPNCGIELEITPKELAWINKKHKSIK